MYNPSALILIANLKSLLIYRFLCVLLQKLRNSIKTFNGVSLSLFLQIKDIFLSKLIKW